MKLLVKVDGLGSGVRSLSGRAAFASLEPFEPQFLRKMLLLRRSRGVRSWDLEANMAQKFASRLAILRRANPLAALGLAVTARPRIFARSRREKVSIAFDARSLRYETRERRSRVLALLCEAASPPSSSERVCTAFVCALVGYGTCIGEFLSFLDLFDCCDFWQELNLSAFCTEQAFASEKVIKKTLKRPLTFEGHGRFAGRCTCASVPVFFGVSARASVRMVTRVKENINSAACVRASLCMRQVWLLCRPLATQRVRVVSPARSARREAALAQLAARRERERVSVASRCRHG